MKTILLSAAASLALLAMPAAGTVLTMGSTYAQSCYLAAEARDTTPKAMEWCNRALSEALQEHDIVGTHVNRGILHMLSGDLRRANRDFDEALRINPRQPDAWLNKAVAQINGGESRAAREMADKALALRTSRPELAYFVRGIANEDTGNLRQAYADLRRASELAPKWNEPALELARYRVNAR